MEFEDGASNNSVRFVLLLHLLPAGSARATHWDLMIRQADALLTFALQALPPQTSPADGLTWPATRLADHRLHYLDYEGVVGPAQPGGPSRGSVQRVAAGWAICAAAQPAAQPATPLCRWRLDSPQLQASFAYPPCAVGQATQLHIDSWQTIP